MGWSIGFDSRHKRDIGYGVPAVCDYPDCNEQIDRGLGYVCGGEPYGGERGCGLFFCCSHRYATQHGELCLQCRHGKSPFSPKPDVREWIEWKLTHESWQQWRDENPDLVDAMHAQGQKL
jgi:hypothetical protein